MAFPTTVARATSRTTTNVTSHPVTLPAHQAGDLLKVFFSIDGSPACAPNEQGWSIVEEQHSATFRAIVFSKIAESNAETLTVTSNVVEQASAVAISFRPQAGKTLAYAINVSQGTLANSDPPGTTIPFGVRDAIWIASRHGDSNVVATAAPADFGNLQTIAAATTAGASTNTAERQLAADYLDPGAFTSAAEQWVSFTVAVWEAPLPPTITTQPTDETVTEGSLAQFSIEADGEDLSFIWGYSPPKPVLAPRIGGFDSWASRLLLVPTAIHDGGPTDWALFGVTSASLTPQQRKSDGGAQISLDSEGNLSRYVGASAIDWEGGTPTASGGYDAGLTVDRLDGAEAWFEVTVPASTQKRAVKILWGAYAPSGSPIIPVAISAVLGDGSAGPFNITANVEATGNEHIAYLEYVAGTDGQTLTIRFTLPDEVAYPNYANITMRAVWLLEDPSNAVIVGYSECTPGTDAASGNLPVTIPPGANAFVAAGIYLRGVEEPIADFTGSSLSTDILDSVTSTTQMSAYLAAGQVSATGAQTVELTKSGVASYDEGPTLQIFWLNVADPADFLRDYSLQNAGGVNTASVQSDVDDTVLALLMSDGGGFSSAFMSGGQPIVGIVQNNSDISYAFRMESQSPSTEVVAPSASYGALAVFTLKGGPDWAISQEREGMGFTRDSGNEYYYRAEAFNHNGPYTMMAPILPLGDPGQFQHFFAVSDGLGYAGNCDFVGTENNPGLNLRIGCAGGATNTFDGTGNGSIPDTGGVIAMVRESPTLLHLYFGPTPDEMVLVTTLTDDVSARAASTHVLIGGYAGSAALAAMYAPRIWQGRALTLAELKTEAKSSRPVITSNLWSAPEFRGLNPGDDIESGNNRDFTFQGSTSAVVPDALNLYARYPEHLVAQTTLGMTGDRYRCMVANETGQVSSDVAVLTVNEAPPPTSRRRMSAFF